MPPESSIPSAETPPEAPNLTQAEKMLRATEALAIDLKATNNARFGQEFSTTIQSRMNGWMEALVQKGDTAIDRIEARGVPLPKSKLGMRVLSGVTGVTGAVVPGLGVLLPLSYVLWKRGDQISKSETAYVS